jgi:acyl-CoA thioester hydrolase
MAYFERIGFLEHQKMTGIGPILASTSCRFRRALTYPDRIQVGIRTIKIEQDRFTMQTHIVSHTMNDLAAESEGIIVSYDYRSQSKAPLPPLIRIRIEQLESGALSQA